MLRIDPPQTRFLPTLLLTVGLALVLAWNPTLFAQESSPSDPAAAKQDAPESESTKEDSSASRSEESSDSTSRQAGNEESEETADETRSGEKADDETPNNLAGQQLLDEAFQLKLNARRLGDLDKVVMLAEQAIERGLDDGGKEFARQLASSTLLEKAMQLVGPVLEGQLDLSWNQRRRLALNELERAIKLNPQDGEVELLAARLHALPDGDPERGKAAAEEAVKLLAGNSERLSAALVVRAGYTEDAKERIELYDRAILSNDRNAEAWRERGKAKFELGRTEEALADFRHLLETNADDLETLQAVAAVLASQEKYDEAIEHANRMVDIDPEQTGGYLIRSRIYLAKGDMEAAEDDLDKVLELTPRDLGALMTRARLRQVRNANEEALADVNRVLQLRPGWPQAVFLRSSLYIASKEYAKAIEDVKNLLRANPDQVVLQLQLAGIYLASDRPSLAIKTYNEVLAEDNTNLNALRGRADAYLSLGKHAEAVKDYEEALKLDPSNSGVLNNFAWVLATSPFDEVRNGERAIELALKACEETKYEAPHILSTLAASYAETGKFEEAKQWAQKALDMADESIKKQLADELDHYTQGKPFRELQVVKEPDEPEPPNVSDLKLDNTQPTQESARKTE